MLLVDGVVGVARDVVGLLYISVCVCVCAPYIYVCVYIYIHVTICMYLCVWGGSNMLAQGCGSNLVAQERVYRLTQAGDKCMSNHGREHVHFLTASSHGQCLALCWSCATAAYMQPVTCNRCTADGWPDARSNMVRCACTKAHPLHHAHRYIYISIYII